MRFQHVVVAGVDNAIAIAIGSQIGSRAERIAPERVIRGIDNAIVVVVADQRV